ncbi:hypothetical protein [Sphingomonas humi]|uniref:Uncharacterized protein n=1 Tax=Sphingomonas humi TaxID=335630 RepID=A0ABP7RZB6_9SPHN
MHRSLALCLALIPASASIATTGFAAEIGRLDFDLKDNSRDKLQLTVRRSDSERNRISSTSFDARDLAGLDRAALNGRDGAPVRFAMVREPGRLDCTGATLAKRARGTCRFTGNAAFADYLVASGMRRPSEEEWLTLTMVGARRDLVEALKQGRFEMPSPKTLAGMTALDVTPAYIRDLAAYGYRLRKPEDLLPLKAMNVSPAYLQSLKSVGYDRVPVEELIQLKALGVTAEFIASYQRRGFKNLSVSRLVQLKALGIRPDDIGRAPDAGGGGTFAMEGGAYFVSSSLMP